MLSKSVCWSQLQFITKVTKQKGFLTQVRYDVYYIAITIAITEIIFPLKFRANLKAKIILGFIVTVIPDGGIKVFSQSKTVI